LPNEIMKIEQFNKMLASEPKQPGSPRRDLHAQITADTARKLFEIWKCKPGRTERGKWHQLSDLIYEAVTGQEKCTWKYCREWYGPSYYTAIKAGIDWAAATEGFEPSECRIAVHARAEFFLTLGPNSF
jgi:hypothetical protein